VDWPPLNTDTFNSKGPRSHLSGVMVSVLATGPKVHGFKPGHGNVFLRVIKIHSTPSFRGQVKLSSHVIRSYDMLNNSKSTQEIFRRQNPSFTLHRSSWFATGWFCWKNCQRALCWMNQDFSPLYFIPPWFSMFMYHLGDERYACWWLKFRDVISPHRYDQSVSQSKGPEIQQY
jgi:hypothetical protein